MTDTTGPSRYEPVRGVQKLWRSSFGTSHRGVRYDIDVDFLDVAEKVRLYENGLHVDTRTCPAAFPVPGGQIEAGMSMLGMKRAHLVTPAGERQLQPNPGTLEAWRMGLDRCYPAASRVVSALSWLVLVLALVMGVLEVAELVLPRLGIEADLFRFPAAIAAPLGVLGLLAAFDRALRLRYNRWLDTGWDGLDE